MGTHTPVHAMHNISIHAGGKRFTNEARKACPCVATPAACLCAANARLLPAHGTSAAWERQKLSHNRPRACMSTCLPTARLGRCLSGSRRPTSTLPSTEQALHPIRKGKQPIVMRRHTPLQMQLASHPCFADKCPANATQNRSQKLFPRDRPRAQQAAQLCRRMIVIGGAKLYSMSGLKNADHMPRHMQPCGAATKAVQKICLSSTV